MNENIFRILAALILMTGVGISSYFRRRADKETGEKISRQADGTLLMMIIKICGLVLWLSPIIYLINPAWMSWSKMSLPDSVRGLGVVLGLMCVGLIYWLFSSIGHGISPTSATRQQHTLVTHGPYRWVRHPLYSVGAMLFIGLGLIADSWFIAAVGIGAFILMVIRTPQEETNLIKKFGDEYREYMQHTGRFFPKIGG
jgi:protein-S-isoprenylcysteine O-methyltransferase Ste14